MTGIIKNELMGMALKSGLLKQRIRDNYAALDSDGLPIELRKFYNAILERASKECDDLQRSLRPTDESAGASMCADIIRALKINTGD